MSKHWPALLVFSYIVAIGIYGWRSFTDWSCRRRVFALEMRSYESNLDGCFAKDERGNKWKL